MPRDGSPLPEAPQPGGHDHDGPAAIFQTLKREFSLRKRDQAPQDVYRSKLLLCGAPGWDREGGVAAFSLGVGLPWRRTSIATFAEAVDASAYAQLDAFFATVGAGVSGPPVVTYLADVDWLLTVDEQAQDNAELRQFVDNVQIFIRRCRPNGFLVSTLDIRDDLDIHPWRIFDDITWAG